MPPDRTGNWLIYGANGYTGELIAREARARGMMPILAGRSEASIAALAGELALEHRIFALDDPARIRTSIEDVDIVLGCAGPFSATAAPIMHACLATRTNYLDITGEIDVFELAHRHDMEARSAGIVICPGVGFDVVPTDCVAAALKEALPEATRLALGYDTRGGVSPGTARTLVEGFPKGGRIRRDGTIHSVPLAYRTRRIDFGDGEKMAMTIPWGDVATAFYTTGIPNIEVYVAASPRLISRIKKLNMIRPLLGLDIVQNLLKRRIERTVTGPSAEERERFPTWVWGEVEAPSGAIRTARIKVANGYGVTVSASLGIVSLLLEETREATS